MWLPIRALPHRLGRAQLNWQLTMHWRLTSLLAFISVGLLVPIGARAQQSSPPPGATQSSADSGSAASQPIPPELASAEAAIASSDWKIAEARLDSWLLAHPADARALFDAGYVADAQDRRDDAAALYRRAVAANPQSFEAHLSLGLLLAREGKSDDARPELVAATKLDPGEAGPELKARAWRALARIDRDADPAEASTDLLEALKLTPETPADTLLAADLAEKAGQFDDAEKAYRRALVQDPKSLPADAGLAHLLIARKQYPEAETLLRAALVQAPDDPTLTAQLATVLAAQDKAEALPLLEKLHALHPDDSAVTRMLATVRADAGDYAGSDQLDAHLLQSSPNDSELLVDHGQNLVHQGQLAQAYTVFDRATRIDSASVDAWSGLAFTASRTQRPDVTLHALTERSQYAPENASTLFLWATAYDSLHQKQQAAAYYRRFLDAAAGKFPDQEWQARQRLQLLAK
jgi:tetratricopeptide (TPR) repeat protein